LLDCSLFDSANWKVANVEADPSQLCAGLTSYHKSNAVVPNWSKGKKEGETTMSSQSTLEHSQLSGILKILMHLMLQALRITKNTSISSVPAASLRTAGDANYHAVCESGRVATKPGQSLTQSKIMSLSSNGSHKAVEPAQGQTGSVADMLSAFAHCSFHVCHRYLKQYSSHR
jgi:hypothetical protein